MSETFKVIETQEQLDAVIGERVKRAQESIRKEFEGFISPKDLETKTAGLNAKVSELEKAQKEFDEKAKGWDTEKAEFEKKIKGYEIDSVKNKVAQDLGLGFKAVQFLQGETEEDIKKSGKMLKELIPSFVTPLANKENFEGSNSTETALRGMLDDLELKGE